MNQEGINDGNKTKKKLQVLSRISLNIRVSKRHLMGGAGGGGGVFSQQHWNIHQQVFQVDE